MDALTGEPLRKVTVRLNPWTSSRLAYTSTTDLSGRFHFETVRAGDYTLEGERAGYLTAALGTSNGFGRRGTVLHLQAGGKVSDLQLKLMRRSVLSGKVVDENGDPVVKAMVSVCEPFWVRGIRQYGFRDQGRTNDAGEYQISGLAPGKYYLYVEGPGEPFVERQGGPEKLLLPVFYPESPRFQSAATLEVHPGQDLPGINFRLHTGSVFHIRGKVEAADLAKRRENVMIEADESSFTTGTSNLDSGLEKDGSFDIDGVPPGSYELQVVDNNSHGSITAMPVEVKAADVNGVKLPLPSRLQLKGTVRMLGSEDATFSGMDVSVRDIRGLANPQAMPVAADGTFQIENLWPGKYGVGVSTKDQNEYVKSILYGGQEVLGLPVDLAANSAAGLEVILAKGAGQVEGTIQSSGGSGPSVSDVVLISDREHQDYGGVSFSAVDQSGHFSFKGVPPGRYFALAAAGVEIGLWANADFTSQLRDKGVEVDVPENGHVQIQVPVLPAADVERALANLPL